MLLFKVTRKEMKGETGEGRGERKIGKRREIYKKKEKENSVERMKQRDMYDKSIGIRKR